MSMGSFHYEGVGMNKMKEQRMVDIKGWSMRSSDMQNDDPRWNNVAFIASINVDQDEEIRDLSGSSLLS